MWGDWFDRQALPTLTFRGRASPCGSIINRGAHFLPRSPDDTACVTAGHAGDNKGSDRDGLKGEDNAGAVNSAPGDDAHLLPARISRVRRSADGQRNFAVDWRDAAV
ncbi:hypothetical protein HPB50_024143 [Hyalomma asiaticum]|uniref:Uncharacterized protein n=1 Tax=Hyalomma asiaticum TaxID=266040 RepID=A0ACB7TNA0_HYAAI|nr:hypothetical protein HPB50_024143 [Hyalomma asiaticum]